MAIIVKERMKVSAMLMTLRGMAKLTQKEMATKLGVSQSTLSRWEACRGKLPVLLVTDNADGVDLDVYAPEDATEILGVWGEA